MIIYIKNLRGDKTELEIQESDTVLSIKEKLFTLQEHPIDLQKLILAGKILTDEKSASESGITEGATLVLMVSKPKPQAKGPVVNPPPQAVNPPPQALNLPSSNLPSNLPIVNAPLPGGNIEGPDALLTGDSLQNTINSIVEMGFDRKDVEASMKAAYNNPDRAIEYLTNGIPDNLSSVPRPAQSEEVNPNEDQFRQIMQDPNFMQLLSVIQQNPATLVPIMTQLQQSNPDIYNLISNNREAFMRMLQEPSVSRIDPNMIAGLPRPPQSSVVVNLTPEEQQAIKNLTELGFTRNDALEAYLSCDKNESLAASLLFENYQPAGAGLDFGVDDDRENQDGP